MANTSRTISSRSGSPIYRHSRVAEAIQVAPYLTHVVKHHGQITLIPPENSARIRKAKKKRPALRTENSGASLDLPRSRTPAPRSRPHTPRPRTHSSNSTRSQSRTSNGMATVSRSSQNPHQHDISIPDFPPPSFEEAMLATPSPRNTTPPVSQVCESSAQHVDPEQAPELPIAAPDPIPDRSAATSANASDRDSLHSDSSHSSLEEMAEAQVGSGPRSLWEQDREAGYSLEERVQRELERRKLADSLPRAPSIHVDDQDDSSPLEEASPQNSGKRNKVKIDDVLLAIQESYRTHRLQDKSRQRGALATISQECERVELIARSIPSSSSRTAAGPDWTKDPSSFEEIMPSALSRKGKEKKVSSTNGWSCNDHSCGSPSMVPSESRLSKIREVLNMPLRPQDDTSGLISDSMPTSPLPPLPPSDHQSLIQQSTDPSSSHSDVASTSHSVSSSTPDSNPSCMDASTDGVALLSSPSSRDSNYIPSSESHSSSVIASSNSIARPQYPSSSRPLPTPPVSPSTSASTFFFPDRRPLPSIPSTGMSVRDRISAFESLQSRPIPPPPRMRPVVRGPPPPVPGPSNFDHIRKVFGHRIEDNDCASANLSAKSSNNNPPVLARRRAPPPVPPRRRPESIVATLEMSDGPSSSLPMSSVENDLAFSSSTSNHSDDPSGPIVAVNQTVSMPEQTEITSIAPTRYEEVLVQDAESMAERVAPVEVSSSEVVSAPVSQTNLRSTIGDITSNIAREEHSEDDIVRGSGAVVSMQDSHPGSLSSHVGSRSSDDGDPETSDDIVRSFLADPIAETVEDRSSGPPNDHPNENHTSDTLRRQSQEGDMDDGRSTSAQTTQPLQPMLTGLTDLDLLLARLNDPDFSFGGQSYDDLLLLEEVMGPAFGTIRQNCIKIEDIPLGRVEVLRRRVTKDGRTKLKLALLGVVVDKCGICLIQFKDGVFACLLPCCHAFHENCLRLWMRRGETCPLCRGPLSV